MILSKEVDAFYISNDRKDKSLAGKYKEVKEIMFKVNFESLSKSLVPTLKEVKEYFKGLRLINQETKNLITERN